MSNTSKPAPSEQALIRLWDKIDAKRVQQGEKAAAQLALKALKAAEQDEETK